MKIDTRITLVNDDGEDFMGIGLIWLLRRIDEFQSIRRAAEDMGLSYVKALRILNTLELNLGERLLERSRGGNERGGAWLTPYARVFLEEYDGLQRDVKRYAESEFGAFVRRIATHHKTGS